MVLAMLKRRKNQPKTDHKAKPAHPPPLSSPSLLPPNALHALPNAPSNGLPAPASPNLQNSVALSMPTDAGADDSDDEIAKFAKQSGIPESIVRIEFKIIQSLYNVEHKDIINRYYAFHVPALLPILKLRYIRVFWKQLSQNSENNFSTQSRIDSNDEE
jgi:hypothetical protein